MHHHDQAKSQIFGREWRTRIRAQGCGSVAVAFWRCEMTNGEQKMLWRGVAAGTLMGLAIGGMIALVIAMKPELFAGLVQ
jgi:hypothetical protein